MKKITLLFFSIIFTQLAISQNTIAVTEFLVNPIDNESTDEFVELYNYGTNPIDLQNWLIEDEDSDTDIITTTSFVLQPGDLCIIAKNKATFEANWLAGVANPFVLEVSGLVLANSADEIIIKNALGNTVWSLAYSNDETEGNATHYTELSSFTTTVWGSKTAPGINRDGNDPATATLGYEKNDATADAELYASTTGDLGSPLLLDLPVVSSCPSSATYTTAGGWSPAVPDANTEAIISEDYNTATGNLTVCDLVVQSGATLTINASEWVDVGTNITVNGTLIIEHEGSLVQNDPTGTVTKGSSGIIEVRKTTPTLSPLGFMFLSSPMSGETRDGVYADAFRVINVVSSNFTVDPALETTDPMDPYFGAEIFLGPDNSFLSNYVASEALTPGNGLVVYPQASITDGNTSYDLAYTQGVLNTGDITYPIQYNGQTKNNFNLLGNPYASAIDMDLLIDANDMINEVYFWEHLTPPSNTIPGYLDNNYSMDDISVYTKAGAVGSGTAADNGGSAPGRYMASGQGFAIKAIEGGSANLLFSNSMRVVDNNDQYRNSEEKDRVWIRLHNEKYDLNSTSLLAFLPQASPKMDKGFDARRIGSSVSLFSKSVEGEALSIQATAAFDKAMQIEMGMASVVEENLQFSIAIENKEGVFANGQDIYLIDTYTGAVTHLNQNTYRFEAVNGMQDNRFVLAFEAPEQLSVSQNTLAASLRLFPNPAQEQFTIVASQELSLDRLTIRSMQGQIVKSLSLKDMQQQQTVAINDLPSGIYLVEIANKFTTTTKKLIVE